MNKLGQNGSLYLLAILFHMLINEKIHRSFITEELNLITTDCWQIYLLQAVLVNCVPRK